MHRCRKITILLAVAPLLALASPDGPNRGTIEIEFSAGDLVARNVVDSIPDGIDADETIAWKLYVPESYDPAEPPGLIVFISPTPAAWEPGRWQSVVDESNLIWISAHRSGNTTPTVKRMVYAVLAPHIAARDYQINPQRVYLSGFSGGGKVASMVAIHFAQLFRGAIYIGGAERWPDEPAPRIETIRNNRYVFIAGDRDFNEDLTRRVYRQYKKAGVPGIKLMIIPRTGHTMPGDRDFRKAVRFLDGLDN